MPTKPKPKPRRTRKPRIVPCPVVVLADKLGFWIDQVAMLDGISKSAYILGDHDKRSDCIAEKLTSAAYVETLTAEMLKAKPTSIAGAMMQVIVATGSIGLAFKDRPMLYNAPEVLLRLSTAWGGLRDAMPMLMIFPEMRERPWLTHFAPAPSFGSFPGVKP